MTASANGSFDVAIVGAGVLGATTALFLERAGMHCVLADRSGICSQASGVNAGTLTMHMTRAELIPYALKGWEMWTNASDWLGGDLGVAVAHGLSLAFNSEEVAMLEERALARREQGAPIEIISPERALEIEPSLNPKLKLVAHCPIDGHVSANLTGKIYRRALVEAGVELKEAMRVDGIERSGREFVVKAGSTHSVARHLVLAGGVWLEEMLAWLGVQIGIKTLNNQLAVTERIQPIMSTVLSLANGLLSLKQFENGTVLIGGGWQGVGDRDLLTTEIIPENMIGNVRLARYAIPKLSETRIVRTWLGFEAETADAMPIIGPIPGVDNAFVIGCVHSGYTSGPYMGKLLAETILGKELEMPLFDPCRFLAAT